MLEAVFQSTIHSSPLFMQIYGFLFLSGCSTNTQNASLSFTNVQLHSVII